MRVVRLHEAEDGTKKFLIALDAGLLIESVLIFHKRTVCACISTQVGCAMNCSFCATGRMGFSRNLSTEEILKQIDFMQIHGDITNIVFMGMGEPLMNIDNVINSIRLLKESSFSWKKITVSTVGLKNISRLMEEKCRIALSLHAPNNKLRSSLVPANKIFSLDNILKELSEFGFSKQNPLMIEYVMLKDVNDSISHADELVNLLTAFRHVLINLIPYNQIDGFKYRCSAYEDMVAFKDRLLEAGLKTIIRTTKGLDSAAACGMLKG